MEFKARYELIGGFALAVIAAIFTFTYWLNNSIGFGAQTRYLILFTQPVSGLQVGGNVFFNGLRVGEITNLALDPGNPEHVSVTVSVDENAPVRSDTRAGLAYQGLTGIAAVQLLGGKADAEPLSGKPGELPVIPADPLAGGDWSAEAAEVLAKVDKILSDNEKPFADIMNNIAGFAKTLGGDKERVDNILNGLERMTGGTKAKKDIIYDLRAPTTFPPLVTAPTWRLVIGDPTVVLALNTDKILLQKSDLETSPAGPGRWSDNLPNLLHKIEERMKPIIYLFTPIFFVSVGLSLNLQEIEWTSGSVWALSSLLLVAAVLGKYMGTLFLKETVTSKVAIGIAMIPRGEVGIIFAELGRRSGIFDNQTYAALILVIAFTTLAAPLVLEWFFDRNKEELMPIEKPYQPPQ